MLLSVGYEVRAYLEGLEVGWWWQAVLRYGGGELCYVWWGFVEGFEVFFFFFPLLLRFLYLEFVGGPAVIAVVVVVVVLGWW